MEYLHTFFAFILHLDQHLIQFVSLYGTWTYTLLFLIIFCETGLVVTPILPGDSLLFAAGTLAASSANALNIHTLFLSLVFASITGNLLNYTIGRALGPKIFHSGNSLLLNKAYLNRAHNFYERYGAKTLIIARFMPIIRTFAPFVAGLAYMNKRQFLIYNLVGAVLWIGSLLYLSYSFGNIPVVKEHFSSVILGIIILSLLPLALEIARKCWSWRQLSV